MLAGGWQVTRRAEQCSTRKEEGREEDEEQQKRKQKEEERKYAPNAFATGWFFAALLFLSSISPANVCLLREAS